jgi:hypothetical protein
MTPLWQSTAQQVMIDKISAGPITVFIIGAHTNFAIFLMNNPHLKKNIEHIFVMGGGVRSKNPTGCCPKMQAHLACLSSVVTMVICSQTTPVILMQNSMCLEILLLHTR